MPTPRTMPSSSSPEKQRAQQRAQTRRRAASIIEDHGVTSGRCGYCSSVTDTFNSHGMQAHSLTVADYQSLIDQGWRRSGTWLYKPALDNVCCPSYTIRLDARAFVPSKNQRRVNRRFEAYLEHRMTEDGVPLDGDDEGRRGQHEGDGDGNAGDVNAGDGNAGDGCGDGGGDGGGNGGGDSGAGSINGGECGDGIEGVSYGQTVRGGGGGEDEDKATKDLASDVVALTEEAVVRAIAACVAKGTMPPPAAAAAAAAPASSSATTKVRPVTAKSARQAGATHSCAVAIALASQSMSRRPGAPSSAAPAAAATTETAPPVKTQTHRGRGGDGDRGGGGVRRVAADVGAALAAELLGDSALAAAGVSLVGEGEGGHLNFKVSAPAAPAGNKRKKTSKPPPPRRERRQFTITTAPSAFVEEEYQLWRRYQAAVHGDDADKLERISYRRFLVDTPLRRVEHGETVVVRVEEEGQEKGWITWKGRGGAGAGAGGGDGGGGGGGGTQGVHNGHTGRGGGVRRRGGAPGYRELAVKAPPSGFGSFHQQYRVDGRLVAVGVVDVLPLCLSSKYFFWEPSLRALALGKLSALREIDWVREASAHCPTLRHHYMGYYIHTCPKMRYKAEYKPSELKCPVSGRWVGFDDGARKVLDTGVFGPLDPLDPLGGGGEGDHSYNGGGGGGRGGSGGAGGEPSQSSSEADDAAADDLSAESDERTGATVLGVVAGNQLLECAPLARLAPGLAPPAVTSLRLRLRRWLAQVGPAGDHVVYLVHLGRLAASSAREEEGDEDEEEEEEEIFWDRRG